MGSLPTTFDCAVHVISFLEPKTNSNMICNRESVLFLRTVYLAISGRYPDVLGAIPSDLPLTDLIHIHQVMREHPVDTIHYLEDRDADIFHVFKVDDVNEMLVSCMKRDQMNILGTMITRWKGMYSQLHICKSAVAIYNETSEEKGIKMLVDSNKNSLDPEVVQYMYDSLPITSITVLLRDVEESIHQELRREKYAIVNGWPLDSIKTVRDLLGALIVAAYSGNYVRMRDVLDIGCPEIDLSYLAPICISDDRCFDMVSGDPRCNMELCEGQCLRLSIATANIHILKRLIRIHNVDPMCDNGKHIDTILSPPPLMKVNMEMLSIMLESPRIDLQVCLEKARAKGNRATMSMINNRIRGRK
jgi:hypothetical protein